MALKLSRFAQGLKVETAFDVLATARQLKAKGKDVVELQIGDSPFPTTTHAKRQGLAAIEADQTHYCPSQGLIEFRDAVAQSMNRDHDLSLTAAHVVAGPGAKVFEQFFCEAFLDAGDEVLVFTPHFPTYLPNIERRGASAVFSSLRQENDFRPSRSDVADFLRRPRAKAIFLNSPHNPTGGVATKEDIRGLCDLIRGKPIALFSDEPYQHMAWTGRHFTPLAEPGMIEQCVAVYTFSKSFSMSGWRLGYAVSHPAIADAIAKMINTSLSCVPPFVQLAGRQALERDSVERDQVMKKFQRKVELLTRGLEKIPGVTVTRPAGTFYVFPNVAPICEKLGLTSHGLATFLLETADDQFGVACLGGECFGDAGQGFLRFSCAEPDERLEQALAFLPTAFSRFERVERHLEKYPQYGAR